jgi:ClpP class serine protease
VINDVYKQFVDLVCEERKAPIKEILSKRLNRPEQGISEAQIRAYVKSYADGRVFSGRMALEYGLVDELGGLDRAVHAAAEMAGLDNPEIVTYRENKTFAELLTGISRTDLRSWASEALGASSRRFGYYAW